MIIELQETKTITKNGNTFVIGNYWHQVGKDLYPTQFSGLFDKEYKPGKYEIDLESSVYFSRKHSRLTLGAIKLKAIGE